MVRIIVGDDECDACLNTTFHAICQHLRICQFIDYNRATVPQVDDLARPLANVKEEANCVESSFAHSSVQPRGDSGNDAVVGEDAQNACARSLAMGSKLGTG